MYVHEFMFFNISCAPDWSAVDGLGLFYNWYLMILGFFVPTTIVLISNVAVLCISKKVIF